MTYFIDSYWLILLVTVFAVGFLSIILIFRNQKLSSFLYESQEVKNGIDIFELKRLFEKKYINSRISDTKLVFALNEKISGHSYSFPEFSIDDRETDFEKKFNKILSLFENKTFEYERVSQIISDLLEKKKEENSFKSESLDNESNYIKNLSDVLLSIHDKTTPHPSIEGIKSENNKYEVDTEIYEDDTEIYEDYSQDYEEYDTGEIGFHSDNNNESIHIEDNDYSTIEIPTEFDMQSTDSVTATIEVEPFDSSFLDINLTDNYELDIDLPYFTIAKSTYREAKLFLDENVTALEAARRVGLDAAGVGGGILLGNIIAEALGLGIFWHIGVNLLITNQTKKQTDNFKYKPLKDAYERYEQAFHNYENSKDKKFDDLIEKVIIFYKEVGSLFEKEKKDLGEKPTLDNQIENYQKHAKEACIKVSNLLKEDVVKGEKIIERYDAYLLKEKRLRWLIRREFMGSHYNEKYVNIKKLIEEQRKKIISINKSLKEDHDVISLLSSIRDIHSFGISSSSGEKIKYDIEQVRRFNKEFAEMAVLYGKQIDTLVFNNLISIRNDVKEKLSSFNNSMNGEMKILKEREAEYIQQRKSFFGK